MIPRLPPAPTRRTALLSQQNLPAIPELQTNGKCHCRPTSSQPPPSPTSTLNAREQTLLFIRDRTTAHDPARKRSKRTAPCLRLHTSRRTTTRDIRLPRAPTRRTTFLSRKTFRPSPNSEQSEAATAGSSPHSCCQRRPDTHPHRPNSMPSSASETASIAQTTSASIAQITSGQHQFTVFHGSCQHRSDLHLHRHNSRLGSDLHRKQHDCPIPRQRKVATRPPILY